MSDVLIRRDGCAGRITLNRPEALNALTHDMCLAIEATLRAWETEPEVTLVIIDGAGGKALSAGGDIVAIYTEGLAGRDDGARQFWRDEYRLNELISRYNKPYIALMDGIVMGGGVGVSAHGSHRVVSERTLFAMPECGIGLIPDVGGTHLLAQMPGCCGEYVGLTGARLTGADCLYGNLADHFIPSDRLSAMVERLCATGDPGVIARAETVAPPSTLSARQAEIDVAFGLSSLAAIMAELDRMGTEFSVATQTALSRGAPLALLATLEAIRQARRDGDLRLALRTEYRFVSMAVSEGEFLEGIRAALIDRDRRPQWRYPHLDDVPAALIARLGQPAKDGDLSLDITA